MLLRSFILIWFSSLLLGCGDGSDLKSSAQEPAIIDVETSGSQTFLSNCNELRGSDGFRQNIFLIFTGDGHGAICMDLEHRLYLVVDTKRSIRSLESVSQQFNSLRISPATLRARMDKDAFILDRDGINSIFRIPPTAEDSFAAELFNHLLGLNLSPTDIQFKWD